MNQTSLKARMLEAFRRRMYYFLIGVFSVFFIIAAQLVNLQIIQGAQYSERSRMNMENNIPIPAARGEIYDRHFQKNISGAVIVSNRASFNLTTVPDSFESDAQLMGMLQNLSLILRIDPQTVFDDIKKSNRWERYLLKDDVSFDIVVKVASHKNLFPNIHWEDAPVRVYNYGEIFSHAVGYTGSISKEEYSTLKERGYKYYQSLGKAGIERQYDSILRGEDGYIRRIVDVKNRTEGEEIGHDPVSGNNLVLTLDYEVQKAAFEAMGRNDGAVIVMKPATGEIIALISKPGYDPNSIISKDNYAIIRDLTNSKTKPFLNRAIQSRYPPASTFKIVTAVAGLETEKLYPEKVFYCPGKWTLKGYVDHDFYCFKVHSSLNLYWALGKSCSVYFYNAGMSIGPTVIIKYATLLGLNEMSGIDLPGEIQGFVPSQRWKLQTFGQPWFDGDTVNLSIGQGFTSVTPIGLTNMMCAIVNNGVVYKPYLVKSVYSPDNRNLIGEGKRQKLREIPLSPVTIQTIKQGMRYSVEGGTSGIMKHLKVKICGKTGTAQTRSVRKENFSQHAWFLGFAPFEGDPMDAVVVTVFIEYGEWGAVAAAPVAEKIFSTLIKQGYFTGNGQSVQMVR
ncbi:MAG: penicillin-binding protein 2 [Spirochaetes bacterium]|nr:penicillin-binding protein 2 [Spirochaetota bacterium]